MYRYDYHRPKDMQEAWRLKAEIRASRWIAGGTDLLVQLRQRRLPAPSALISLRSLEELKRIEAGEEFRLGAMVPLNELARHSEVVRCFPALVAGIEKFASDQIRNVATLGGNLCNASPAADSAPPLLVYGARVELRSAAATRELPLEEFLTGPGKTELAEDEILTAVILKRPSANSFSTFLKRGRTSMDVAVVNVAARVDLEGSLCRTVRLAAGSVAPTPVRLLKTEALLESSRLEEEVLSEAAELSMQEVSPISDLRSTADYRRTLVGVYVRRTMRQCRELLKEAR